MQCCIDGSKRSQALPARSRCCRKPAWHHATPPAAGRSSFIQLFTPTAMLHQRAACFSSTSCDCSRPPACLHQLHSTAHHPRIQQQHLASCQLHPPQLLDGCQPAAHVYITPCAIAQQDMPSSLAKSCDTGHTRAHAAAASLLHLQQMRHPNGYAPKCVTGPGS